MRHKPVMGSVSCQAPSVHQQRPPNRVQQVRHVLDSQLEAKQLFRAELQHSIPADQEEDFNEASYQAFDEEPAPGYPEDPEGDGEDYEDYELCESEAIALNCLEELEESSEAGHADTGHAVQLQLAAHAASGKAKGKGKGKSKKGKGKGKGKVVRSHLTLEQRREKLKSLKAAKGHASAPKSPCKKITRSSKHGILWPGNIFWQNVPLPATAPQARPQSPVRS